MAHWTSTYTQQNHLWPSPQTRLKTTYWLPIAIVLMAIAAESTRAAGTATTEHLLLACTHRLHFATSLSDVVRPNWQLRKSGHFLGYGLLGLLTTRCWLCHLAIRKRLLHHAISIQAATIGMFFTASIASLDEWHQSILPGRSSSVNDVALDTLGALTCIALYLARSPHWRDHR